MAAATVPAVEVRSTVGPRRQAIAPAAPKAALSSPVIPPSGPTTTSRSPDSGRLRRAEAGRGARLQHDRARRLPDQLSHLAGRGGGGDLGYPGAAGLLGCLARGQPPPGQRALPARALPHRDAAGRGPRHDPVHADLGHLLDGQLAPVALGNGLDDGDCGGRDGATSRRARTVSSSPPSAGPATTHSATRPAPSVTSARSPGRSLRTVAACPALGAGQHHDGGSQRRAVGQEDGRLHLMSQTAGFSGR